VEVVNQLLQDGGGGTQRLDQDGQQSLRSEEVQGLFQEEGFLPGLKCGWWNLESNKPS